MLVTRTATGNYVRGPVLFSVDAMAWASHYTDQDPAGIPVSPLVVVLLIKRLPPAALFLGLLVASFGRATLLFLLQNQMFLKNRSR